MAPGWRLCFGLLRRLRALDPGGFGLCGQAPGVSREPLLRCDPAWPHAAAAWRSTHSSTGRAGLPSTQTETSSSSTPLTTASAGVRRSTCRPRRGRARRCRGVGRFIALASVEGDFYSLQGACCQRGCALPTASSKLASRSPKSRRIVRSGSRRCSRRSAPSRSGVSCPRESRSSF